MYGVLVGGSRAPLSILASLFCMSLLTSLLMLALLLFTVQLGVITDTFIARLFIALSLGGGGGGEDASMAGSVESASAILKMWYCSLSLFLSFFLTSLLRHLFIYYYYRISTAVW